MPSHRVTVLDLERAVQAANSSVAAGSFDRGDPAVRVQAGEFLSAARDPHDLVVAVWNGRPVYLRDVADVTDGPGEPLDYVRFHRGPAWNRHTDNSPAEPRSTAPPRARSRLPACPRSPSPWPRGAGRTTSGWRKI
jgi:hypothetical protein